ncbi:hypothetical protein HY633_05125 [Candidatus Uhrbacteria bacterium]|nr:hypothetical protein [Candidatus Uhrbacteria bacterium]
MHRTLTTASLVALFAVSCASDRAPKKPAAAPREAAPKKEAAPKTEAQPEKPRPPQIETRKFPLVPDADWEVLVPKDPKTMEKGSAVMIFVNTAAKASIQVFEFQIEDGSTVMMAESMRKTLRRNGYTVGDLESTDAMPGQPSLFVYRKEEGDGDVRAGQVLAMRLHEKPDVQFVFAAAWPEAVTAEMTGDLYWIAQHFQVRVGDEKDPPPASAPPPGKSGGTTATGPKPEGEAE